MSIVDQFNKFQRAVETLEERRDSIEGQIYDRAIIFYRHEKANNPQTPVKVDSRWDVWNQPPTTIRSIETVGIFYKIKGTSYIYDSDESCEYMVPIDFIEGNYTEVEKMRQATIEKIALNKKAAEVKAKQEKLQAEAKERELYEQLKKKFGN